MTGKELSVHHAKVYLAVKATEGNWITNPDLYKLVPDVAPTTIRLITLDLFNRGLVERVKGHPLFRYRWSTRREGRDHEFETRIEAACQAFGLSNLTPEVGTRFCTSCGRASHAGQLCD